MQRNVLFNQKRIHKTADLQTKLDLVGNLRILKCLGLIV